MFYSERKTFHVFFTPLLDIQEWNTCFYGSQNLSLYIFIRKIISMAFRFLLFLHFTYNGICFLSFWLNRHPCRQAFWNLLLGKDAKKCRNISDMFKRKRKFSVVFEHFSRLHVIFWVLRIYPGNQFETYLVKRILVCS